MSEDDEDLLVILFVAAILTALISTCLLMTEREMSAFVGGFL